MIIKKYNIPIYRELATAEVVKETPENSFFNLEINKEEKTTVNESFETKIYNIERKENQLIIYSNTLNIKVTDIFTESGVPLYYFKEFNINNEEDIQNQEAIIDGMISEYLEGITEYKIDKSDGAVLYFNKTEELLKIRSEYLYNIGNPITRTPNVKVRKLKDRFKITIKNIKGLRARIDLGSRYVFEPVVYKNFKEIAETIVTINNNQYYLYNSSFNILNKSEYNENSYEVKDPVSMLYVSNNNWFFYDSWRSNLLFDEKLKTKYYYYLKLNSPNATDLVLQSLYKQDSSNLLFMFSSDYSVIENEITINPFTEIEAKKPLGENFSLVYKDNSYTKYNNYNDIKFGTEQLQLNFENVYKDKSLYLIDGGDVIYQSNKLNFENEYTNKTVEDLPPNFLSNLNDLKSRIGNIVEVQPTSLDNKIYTKE